MRTILTILITFLCLVLQAQDNTGIMQPNASNLLMPRGVYDLGFRLPRSGGTPAGTPRLLNLSYWGSKGALVYDTTGGRVLVYNGTSWAPIATPLTLTTTGSSGPATYNAGTGVLNVPAYTLAGLGGVPTTRTLTINGTALDLSADRSWTIAGSGISTLANIGSTPNAQGASISGSTLTLQPANASFGGVVTTGAQTFAGNKTLSGILSHGSSTGVKQYWYDGGVGVRWGVGVNGGGNLQFFNTGGAFTWNSGGDLQPFGTNELMRLSSTGLTLNVPLSSVPSLSLNTIDHGALTGIKQYWFNGGAGLRWGAGVNSGGNMQFFNSGGFFSWNFGGDLQSPGVNEMMRVSPSGLTPPRLTQAQRDAISSPAAGLTLYCTNCTATDGSTGVMQTYNGSTWKNNW